MEGLAVTVWDLPHPGVAVGRARQQDRRPRVPFHPLGREGKAAGRHVTPSHPGACPISSTQAAPASEVNRKQTRMPLLKVLERALASSWLGPVKARPDPRVLALYPRPRMAEHHPDELTSRSPASKDQTSSLVSTCHTFKRPLMSPVATRVESWLKPAQVTESLWPARAVGRKRGEYQAPERTSWGGKKSESQRPAKTRARTHCHSRRQHPQVSSGVTTPASHSTTPNPACVFPALSTPHLCPKHPLLLSA